MPDFLLNTGLVSFGLWLGVAGFLLALVRLRRRPGEPVLPGSLMSTAVLVLVALGTLSNVGISVFKAVVAPRDILQDIVSAREFLAGRSLYPERMNELMREELANEPDLSAVLPWPEPIRERLAGRRNTVSDEHWVQAHPPLATLLVAPLVALGGTLLTQAIVFLVSAGALGLSLWIIARRLGGELTARQRLLLVLIAFAAEPVVACLRLGQSGLLLLLLIVIAWDALHRRRWAVAGIAIGIATCIKIFPGLLLLYLLCRHRRAFLVAVMTVAALWGLVALVAGPECISEYAETARTVVDEYEAFPGNLSLLGLLSRPVASDLVARAIVRIVFYLLAGAVLILTAFQVWRPTAIVPAEGEALDREYSLCVALMPLLSPIAWDHYLVVLLLPLSILGRQALARDASWQATLGYFAILLLLLVPETTFTWPTSDLEGGARLAANFLVLPLRTCALIALCFWLARPPRLSTAPHRIP